MNTVKRLHQAEYGYCVPREYDFAIRYLKSYSKHSFTSLLHSDSSENFDTLSPMNACRFCKDPAFSNYVALANEDGFISIHDADHGAVKTQIQGHSNVIFDLAWCPGALRLVSVSGDHTAMLWDVGETLSPLLRFQGHERSVKTVSFKPENKNVFATGARDGRIMVWDSRMNQSNLEVMEPDNSISSCHYLTESGSKVCNRKTDLIQASITGLIFQNEYALISCADGDPLIKVWDMRKCYSIYKRIPQPYQLMSLPDNSLRKGFSSMVLDQSGVSLYANCMNDTIYRYNVGTYIRKPVAMYKGHTNRTFYIKSCLSGDDKYLVSGSSDGKASIWNVKKPGQPIAQLIGHRAEVTSVDCCSKGEIKLVTCSDDGLYRFWKMSPNTDQSLDEEKQTGVLQGWGEPVVNNGVKREVSLEDLLKNVQKRVSKSVQVTIVSDSTLHSNKRLKQDDQRTALSPYSTNHMKCTESKSKGARRLFDVDTTGSCSSETENLSPTSNLPNYIIDGTSPHHRCSVNRQKENQNWLTKLQVTPPPNNPRVTPKRKSAQKTPKACGNLLKFFKVSTKQSPSQACESQKDVLAEPIVPLPSTS